jgi:hypothetical protein
MTRLLEDQGSGVLLKCPGHAWLFGLPVGCQRLVVLADSNAKLGVP